MAEKLLGPAFAIHGGGSDLIFPHHENEIAQSQAADRPFARVWMHNGMIQLAEEKMSKSVGNIFQLSEALDRYGAETLVAYLISGHYRQPLAFSEGALDEAKARVERIRNFLRELTHDDGGGEAAPFVVARREDALAALADDFNTPRALAALFGLIAEGHRRPLPGARRALAELLPLLGLDSVLEAEEATDVEAERLVAEREEARAARDFERADALREELAERGWEIRDTDAGPRLVRRR
jgi:cysteinyl-tRNA synthetase